MLSISSVPISDTLRRYDQSSLAADLTAAVIVTLMLVPQSLAYAMLAGLPPEVGLYSSLLPLMAYSLFGTSNVLAVGPVAVISLMTGVTILGIDSSSVYTPVQIAIHLALISGVMLIMMCVLRLGFMVNFMSRSVIDGFIMASAILIIFSQMKHILQIEVSGNNVIEMSLSIINHIDDVHLVTFFFSMIIIGVLLISRYLLPQWLNNMNIGNKLAEFLPKLIPALLVVVSIFFINTGLFWSHEIIVVGEVPAGLPDIKLLSLQPELIKQLLLPALLISVIGYVESFSVAIEYASRTRSNISANKELFALGMANIGSSLSGGMPVTGGFSRSVVNFQAGARTPVAGFFAAILIALLILGFAEYLQQLPKATLAATIIVAVSSLISLKKLYASWQFSRYDFILTMITIMTTLTYNVEVGVSVGIILSICLHLYQTSKPHLAIIGQVPETEHFRNVLRHSVKTEPEIIGIRIDENLYFANAQYLEHEIIKLVKQSSTAKYCILQFTSVSDIDTTALHCLDVINDKLQALKVELHLSEVKGPVMDKLQHTELYKKLKDRIHLTHFQAVEQLK